MGIIQPPKAPALSAARSTVEGYDPKVHDPFFDHVNDQLADRGFITANETAALEFSREIAKTLRLRSDEEIRERYDYMKNGMFPV